MAESGLSERGICRWEPRAVVSGAAKIRKYKNTHLMASCDTYEEFVQHFRFCFLQERANTRPRTWQVLARGWQNFAIHSARQKAPFLPPA